MLTRPNLEDYKWLGIKENETKGVKEWPPDSPQRSNTEK